MNSNELFRLLKAEQDKERAQNLERARKEALTNGKEPFDLAVMDSLWRDNPDARSESQEFSISLEQRIAEWSEKYYVQYTEVRNMKDFVARMIDAQVHGFFD